MYAADSTYLSGLLQLCTYAYPVESYRIDPTAMKAEEQHILGELLTEHPEITVFKAGKTYKNIKLSHTLFKRKDSCYEVLKKKSTGDFLAEGTIRLAHQVTYTPERRFVKVYELDTSEEQVMDEYKLTPAYLHMTPPVLIDDLWHIFMDYVEGPTLHELLEARPLSYEKQIALCLAIAKAVKTQVFDNDLVHCDLHPGNVIVRYDEKKNKLIVTIIDFGEAQRTYIVKREPCGKNNYHSPESLTGKHLTWKSDIFSMGQLFRDILGENQRHFQDLLDRMTAHDPEDRPDILAVAEDIILTQFHHQDRDISDAQ